MSPNLSWDANIPPLLRDHLREEFRRAEMWLSLREVLEARSAPSKPPAYTSMAQYNVFGFEQPDPLWSQNLSA